MRGESANRSTCEQIKSKHDHNTGAKSRTANSLSLLYDGTELQFSNISKTDINGNMRIINLSLPASSGWTDGWPHLETPPQERVLSPSEHCHQLLRSFAKSSGNCRHQNIRKLYKGINYFPTVVIWRCATTRQKRGAGNQNNWSENT